MFGHLSEETLMDVVDGTAAQKARAHVETCLSCRTRVTEAAEAWTLAEASLVPEPPSLYFEAFRRQVARGIETEGRKPWLRFLVPLAATAALLLAVPRLNPPPIASAPLAAGVLPAWSALPAAEDDPGLEVLAAVASADSDLAASYERNNIQELLSDLSDEESQALAERLKTDEAKAGAL